MYGRSPTVNSATSKLWWLDLWSDQGFWYPLICFVRVLWHFLQHKRWDLSTTPRLINKRLSDWTALILMNHELCSNRVSCIRLQLFLTNIDLRCYDYQKEVTPRFLRRIWFLDSCSTSSYDILICILQHSFRHRRFLLYRKLVLHSYCKFGGSVASRYSREGRSLRDYW